MAKKEQAKTAEAAAPVEAVAGLDENRVYSKKEVQAFVAEISKRVLEPNTSHLHSVLAINHLLRQANMPEMLDTDLRDQLKDIWIKLKSTGVQLNDPPLLFGVTQLSVQE